MSPLPQPQPSDVESDEVLDEEVGDRLAWYARELGVREERLLALLGLNPADVPKLPGGGVDWRAVGAEHEDAALWADCALYDALGLFNYDIRAMHRDLVQPRGPEFQLVQPGGEPIPLHQVLPAERDRSLLLLVANGGSVAALALLAYLSQH